MTIDELNDKLEAFVRHQEPGLSWAKTKRAWVRHNCDNCLDSCKQDFGYVVNTCQKWRG